jgi:hypothetical protein
VAISSRGKIASLNNLLDVGRQRPQRPAVAGTLPPARQINLSQIYPSKNTLVFHRKVSGPECTARVCARLRPSASQPCRLNAG